MRSRVSQMFLMPPGKTSKRPLRAASLSHFLGMELTSTVEAEARSRCLGLVR